MTARGVSDNDAITGAWPAEVRFWVRIVLGALFAYWLMVVVVLAVSR